LVPVSWFLFELFYTFVLITDVLVYVAYCNSGLLEMDNIIKLLILFGECHIHKAKCISTVPNVRLFSTDLKIFYDSNFNTQQAKSSKDIKTVERDTSCIRNMIDM